MGIKTYVQCSACGGFQTEMKKEQRFRSHILCCTDCHAEKYLNPISNRRTRFTARTREDKFAARRAPLQEFRLFLIPLAVQEFEIPPHLFSRFGIFSEVSSMQVCCFGCGNFVFDLNFSFAVNEK